MVQCRDIMMRNLCFCSFFLGMNFYLFLNVNVMNLKEIYLIRELNA